MNHTFNVVQQASLAPLFTNLMGVKAQAWVVSQSVSLQGMTEAMNVVLNAKKELEEARNIILQTSGHDEMARQKATKQTYEVERALHACLMKAATTLKTTYDNLYPESSSAVLHEAPLKEKRAVLAAMKIIAVPVGAALLGVAEKTLYDFTYGSADMFGATYTGRKCYSMQELAVIAKNPEWLCEYGEKVQLPEVGEQDMSSLDGVVLLDAKVACAYTDMTLDELNSNLCKGFHPSRPYRLADLEKIRVAKLHAAH